MKHAMHVAAVTTSIALLLACSASAQDDEDPAIGRANAPAVPAIAVTADGKTDRLEFDFGRNRGKAWLSRKGELYVETWVQHRGLLCATYEVGVRFGHGDPGCANVQWLAPAKYVTSRRQCNNAIVQHIGVDTEFRLGAEFDQVTCAQRMIRCASGSC
jgi:hypothetical protein